MAKGLIDVHTGLCKLAIRQGAKPRKSGKDVKKLNKIKDVCLNCTEPVCKGCSTTKFKEKMRGEENGLSYL